VKVFCAHPVLVKCQVIMAVTNIGNTFQCISLLPSSPCVHKYLLTTKKKELAAAFCILRNGLFIYLCIYYIFDYLHIYLFRPLYLFYFLPNM
jgi:hypothetical protein